MSTETLTPKELHIEEYLKLLPKEIREQSKEIFMNFEEDQFEDVFQEILRIMNDELYNNNSSSDESYDTEDEYYDNIINKPDEDEMEEYEIYLHNLRMENELEEIQKIIPVEHNNYPTDMMPIAKARKLVEQYNSTPVVTNKTPQKEIESYQIYRKTNYVINYNVVLCISRYIHHTKLDLKTLIKFLDNYHTSNDIVDEMLYITK